MSTLVIIGGGFAGISAAMSAAAEIAEHKADITITLASNSPYITNRVRLYENSSPEWRTPLVATLDPVGVNFVEGEVGHVDTSGQTVEISSADGGINNLHYDRLIVATGSQLSVPDIPGATDFAWNIDAWEAAKKLDRHLSQLAQQSTPQGGHAFVILGAGLTGIELACEMRTRLAAHGGDSAAKDARVILVDRRTLVGPKLEDDARKVIDDALHKAGVEIRMKTSLVEIGQDAALLDNGERIEAATVILVSGMRASPLASAFGTSIDGLGRLHTDDDLRVTGIKNIYAAGDIAHATVNEAGRAALMTCQHGRVMGQYAGYNAAHDLLDLPRLPYRQERYVTCIDLGPAGAVLTTGWARALEKQGDEANALKRKIVEEMIMPPTDNATEILATGKLQIP